MAGNIIPAIATTNAMTAGLCVLQAFKVMRNQLDKARFSFLTRSTDRVIASEALQKPNPHCATCGVAYATLYVDTKRAKLSNLVEDVLRGQLGYGEYFSVNRESELLYDIDEDVHLDKTFAELHIKPDSFITVSDEADQDCKVDVVFSIIEQEVKGDAKLISLPTELNIPKKPAKPIPATNGHAIPKGKIDATMNGFTTSKNNGTTKRTADDAGLEDELVRKKGKVMEEMNGNDDVITIEDDGAIVLD
jgi:ubiquitin-like 1-activating enzyme E1 B